MEIPNLNNLIKAFDCNYFHCPTQHRYCPYGYNKWDDSGDNPFWTCDEDKMIEDAVFYLKLYQKLIEEQNNDSV